MIRRNNMRSSEFTLILIFISIITLLSIMLTFTHQVKTDCLAAGYPDRYVGYSSSSSYCIDKYKSITIPYTDIN